MAFSMVSPDLISACHQWLLPSPKLLIFSLTAGGARVVLRLAIIPSTYLLCTYGAFV